MRSREYFRTQSNKEKEEEYVCRVGGLVAGP